MLTDEEESKKPRSERLFSKRKICFDHAHDLIEAAERILSAPRPIPNIAFHLILLAIEEMGKAGLLTSREASAGVRDSGWIDKRLDDHAFKLLWGLWAPTFRNTAKFDPEGFVQLKEFSQRAHLQRLAGLYVGTVTDEGVDAAPKDAINLEETTSLLAIAKRNLQQLLAEGSPDIDANDALLQWFWETVSDDIGKQRLFSASFAAKYAEFDGDARKWVRWAQEEFEKIRREEKALLEKELNCGLKKSPSSTPRWRLTVRVYCASHSIRPKILRLWNDKVPLAKLKYINNSEMLLELTLGDHINVSGVFEAGQSASKLIVACLNIGTAGYFWFELPKPTKKYFDKVEDLANLHMKVDISGGYNFQRHWFLDEAGRKLTVLEETYLEHAAKCAVVFGPMPDADAAPIFGAYLLGLTLLGKSDIHLSLENNAFAAFHAALQNALKHFGDWDGESESLSPTLHRLLSEIIPEPENRDKILGYLSEPPKTFQELQEYTIAAKRVVDLYLVIVANRLWPPG